MGKNASTGLSSVTQPTVHGRRYTADGTQTARTESDQAAQVLKEGSGDPGGDLGRGQEDRSACPWQGLLRRGAQRARPLTGGGKAAPSGSAALASGSPALPLGGDNEGEVLVPGALDRWPSRPRVMALHYLLVPQLLAAPFFLATAGLALTRWLGTSPACVAQDSPSHSQATETS
ncbi:hypothetical protein D5R93_04320 [Actinomyces lilanjuaniae]|uniref:Uncharacterized protein n=2 Tax=Actinomyces lilanjuaniae TaxID=2321394 RepID=A0ABM6Z2I8_9ACTO|nr:hypothetical protein D5R93_04320 [Actinomyces lilanjuaniae]